MNGSEVEILPSAKKDLLRGFDFYERQESGIGAYFVNKLSAEAQALQFTAGIHSKRGSLFRVKSRKFPYWIYYAIVDSVVYVSAVLDARRSPVIIRKREKKEQEFFYGTDDLDA
ncbi:MAG: type II toxin-antitoxin system RelE/ParE family toxin [Chthoniobacterales bacterium]|nr:type II toxin-antitoxin system RelE/ParE family toxin [Chthoniobacterales bacterium]